MIGTGISLEIPEGYVGLLVLRSSISKLGWMLSNSVGIIDSDFRGEIMFSFTRLYNSERIWTPYSEGSRIGQIVLVKHYSDDIEEVQELNETVRGEGGFGSTGK